MAYNTAMEIIPGAHLIESRAANSYLILDESGLTLIDAGLPLAAGGMPLAA